MKENCSHQHQILADFNGVGIVRHLRSVRLHQSRMLLEGHCEN